MAATGDRNDPYSAFNFLVEIDGVFPDGKAVVAGFSEVSGLESDSDVIEYRNGNEDVTKRKLPGLNKFANITLKRGFTKSADLWKWRKSVTDGKVQRLSGAVVLLDETRAPALRYNFRGGWPSKWTGPALHAGTSEVAIETLEIACEAIELEQ
ncbi:phage tail protein [Rhizobium leguminosarum]|uniref:phage tail protein n=1 Tax=Rhizobium leguminosarum TaxID=384 RepID=UPI0003F8C360|nr:phage tail protein [Rhizobium leguminosarum]